MSNIIYGKKDCKYCEDACDFLALAGIDYQYFSIPEDISKEDLEKQLGFEIKTVPIIFIDGRWLDSLESLFLYEQYNEINEKLSKGIMNLEYIKINGDLKSVKATRNVGLIPEEFKPKATILFNPINTQTVRYFDIDLTEWRSFQTKNLAI